MGRRPLWAARARVAVPACGVPEAQGGRPAPLVAVLGGGQLGRMLALAGIPLGVGFRFLDPSPDATVGALGLLVVGALGDETALTHVTEGAAVVTYEWEGVPAAGARFVAATGTAVLPPPVALEVTQDRLREKELCRRLGVGTPEFAVVDDRADLERAVKEVGLPAVLKTRRGGYDGKGQAALREQHDLERAWSELGGVPLVLESLVPFDRELSVLAVRGRDGATACWPLGSTAAIGVNAMVNCIDAMPDPAAVLAIPGAHLHDYAKAPRPGRKVGHVTVTAPDAGELRARVTRLADLPGVDVPA